MGPGCPVCITPQGEIDAALDLVEKDCIIATYGDLLRVPGSKGSLESCGGDVRIVQGVHKAVEIAEKTDKEVVFISVGFETTAPTVAASILSNPPKNFSILSCHRIVPPAMKWLLEQGEANLDGFVLPGHVCAIMGYEEYEQFPVPQVVAGFEAEDILLGLLMLVEQVREGKHRVDNAYPRVVTREGNVKAKKIMYEVFEPSDVEWRGLPGDPAVRPQTQRRIRAVRRAEEVWPCLQEGEQALGLHLRQGAAGDCPADRLQALREGLHAPHSCRALHGQPRGGL